MNNPGNPSIARILHYHLPPRFDGDVRWRPAFVVNEFGNGLVNLTVFLDGLNDAQDQADADAIEACGTVQSGFLFLSVGSAQEGTGPGEWRWPPRA